MNKGEFQKLRRVLRHILENESRVRTAVFERLAKRRGQARVLEATALFMLEKNILTTTALVPTAVLKCSAKRSPLFAATWPVHTTRLSESRI